MHANRDQKKSIYGRKNFMVKDNFDAFADNLKNIIRDFFVEFDSKNIKKFAAE